jgi:hypothetical protein
MNVLELSQQIYNDQQRLQAKQIKGYAIYPLYHYDGIRFSVSVADGNYDYENPKYMVFNADCELINHVGFTGLLDDKLTNVPHVEFAKALKQYLAQEVE